MRSSSLILLAAIAATLILLLQVSPVSGQAVCDVYTITVLSNGEQLADAEDVRGSEDDYYYQVQLKNKLTNPVITYSAAFDLPHELWSPDNATWYLNGHEVGKTHPPLSASPLEFNFSVNVSCGLTNVLRLRLVRDEHIAAGPLYCNHTYTVAVKNPRCCIVGDPQFAGLLGQSFQVHGIDGAVYSLISAPTFLVNARFEFLTGPRDCPVMPSTGLKSSSCWTHAGSYLGAVGMRTSAGDVLLVESGSAQAGFASVTLNDKTLHVEDSIELANNMGHVVFNTTHEMTVVVGMFSIDIENIDGFVNLRSIYVLEGQWPQLSAQRVHGLLGQTWQARRYSGSVKEIEGVVDDYVIQDDVLAGHQFVFDRFVAA